MNWQAIGFDWNQLRAFLAAAETGSLSAGARALGLAQPTLGRQVAALEARLGVALFERVGRGVALTPSGVLLREHARAMGEAANRVALVAAGASEDIAGRVCISASDAMAAYVLPDILAELSARAPEIEIEIVATNALSDLLRREADIALRHVRPEEPELVARLIREGAANLYATPVFLRRYGRPQTLEALRDLPFIGFGPAEQMAAVLKAHGLPVTAANFRLFSANTVAAWELVRRGLGIGVMADVVARRTPDVERILPDVSPIPMQLWLTTHRDVRTSRRIRVVFDYLAEALAH